MAVVDMINHPSIMACKQHTRPEIIYLTHYAIGILAKTIIVPPENI